MTIRVLVVDDQPVVRAGFHTILEGQPDIDVVGEAEDGQEAVTLARSLRPDVVLMDVRMPRMDGIEATRQIMSDGDTAHRPTHVLILTTFDLDDYVYAALQAGASGFLLKDASRDDLVHAVRVVAAGEALLAPAVTRRLIAEFITRPNRNHPDDSRLETLTSREREVLLHLARGRSNAEIAAELILGEATIKSHVAHVLMKLDLRDRVQAVILAYELGLVTPGEA
jgi:DNA-binding NarL/FixJ family response regulator